MKSEKITLSRLESFLFKAAMKDFTGKSAIPFNRCDSNGQMIHLYNYKGNWLLMVFHRHLG